jgi:exopolyphosphatase/guanosine-5'-triphosphate,3'-diphosphate pyrophosphatase
MTESETQAAIERPLDLDPEHAGRTLRAPYAIVDIGSNSVRLVVYDQLGRAPLPRFNEKLLCRLGEGLAETGAIQEQNFRRTVQALRRFSAIAEAMGVVKLDVTGTEAIRRASNGPALARAIHDEAGLDVRILSGEEEASYSTLGVISGFFRPVGTVGDMGGGSLEVAQALDDRVGETMVSLPLGALPVEALLAKGLPAAKRAVDDMLQERLPPSLAGPVFYAVGGGWRAFAKVHIAAVNGPVKVVHGYSLDAKAARGFAKSLLALAPAKLAAAPGVPTRRARTLPAAAFMLDRVLKRLKSERVVFSALGLREGIIYSQLTDAERYLDPLVEGAQLYGLPLARVPEFALTLVGWTEALFPSESAAERRLRVAVCALSDIVWRDPPEMRDSESFRRILQFPFIGVEHVERVFLAAAIHFRYTGRTDAPWLEPAISMLTMAQRRRAEILGRALLVAYRIAGGVPSILESASLKIEPDRVVLAADAARAPDSEVVGDRLKLLAAALGVRKWEVAGS